MMMTRMALSRAHTSAKVADVAELLLLNKCCVTHILPCHNLNPNVTWSRLPPKSYGCFCSAKFCENQL